jgi:hypothetical protein
MHANDDGIGELFGRARGYASHDFESEAVCAIDGRDAYEPPFSVPSLDSRSGLVGGSAKTGQCLRFDSCGAARLPARQSCSWPSESGTRDAEEPSAQRRNAPWSLARA